MTLKKRSPDNSQLRANAQVDDMIAFEEFQAEILPYLRKAVKRGASAQEIYKKAQAIAAARAVSIAMTSTDEAKALSAIKDILDRSQGKATEKREVTHKYNDLTDAQIDALLNSKLEEADELDDFETSIETQDKLQ